MDVIMIGTQIGKYSLQKYIGGGQFGNVYLAHDIALNAQKAIKIIQVPNPQETLQKLEEAQILHKCKHKHIVEVKEANIYQVNSINHIVIDMEYLTDGSFEDKIAKNHISIHESINIVIDSLFGLEHAHNQGVLHRDIKPANILLDNRTGAKLSDFGLATILNQSYFGSAKGYTTHIAPEVFITNQTNILSDIYAVGITLFRACNFIDDWQHKVNPIPDLRDCLISGNLVPTVGYLPFIPLKLKRIINKACHPIPSKRYQSTIEFRQALEKLRPNINWIPSSPNSFQGRNDFANDSFFIELVNSRGLWKVNFKKNNRRHTDSCKQFNDEHTAFNYFNEVISKTLFD